jgi:activator of 2-hydroxyglutaryl-CoA dehydratase
MLLADFGTTYSKFIDLETDDQPYILETKALPAQLKVDTATGHNGKRFTASYINELTALAKGGESLIPSETFTILDCGSRDIKYIRYKNNQLADMGWNAECGASMGFTIELLERYYEIDFTRLTPPKSCFSITCGVLGMSHIFDEITTGISPTDAVAKFVKSIAINAFRFAGEPETIHLSGGLCDNRLFTASFPCTVIPLGRYVLLEGLRRITEENK